MKTKTVKLVALDNLEEFIEGLSCASSDINDLTILRRGLPKDYFKNAGNLYCTSCTEFSGMKITTLFFEKTVAQELFKALTEEDDLGLNTTPKSITTSDPSLFRLNCVNCSNITYAIIFKSKNNPKLVLIPTRSGGIATPNTPEIVRYFADQAHKAQLATAYSGALVMYRAALEQILLDKGFTGKLPAMIMSLESKVASGIAPSWARRLNTEILKAIKDIGNSHAHPSELTKLLAIDSNFMHSLQKAFTSLLVIVYEQETRHTAAKAKLQSVLKKAQFQKEKLEI